MASVFEAVLARVEIVLAGATDAGTHVFRGRADAFDAADLPAINVRRTNTVGDVIGTGGERHVIEFEIECIAAGADYETDADALHMQAHALLLADAALAARGRGLRCTGTELAADSADAPAGRITARYQMQVFVRPGDLAVAV